jgi:hypothetical protein
MKALGSAVNVALALPVTRKLTPEDGIVEPGGGISRKRTFEPRNSRAATGNTAMFTSV